MDYSVGQNFCPTKINVLSALSIVKSAVHRLLCGYCYKGTICELDYTQMGNRYENTSSLLKVQVGFPN